MRKQEQRGLPRKSPQHQHHPVLQNPSWKVPAGKLHLIGVKFREAGFLSALKTQETHSLMLVPAGRHSRTQENGKLETFCRLTVLLPVSEPTHSLG